MQILFHHAAIVQPAAFADGLFPAPIARSKPFSATDAAWKAGFDAAVESGFENNLWDVYPPAGYSAAEAWAFTQGAAEGFKSVEWEMEEARKATATTQDEYDGWYADMIAREGRDAFIGHA